MSLLHWQYLARWLDISAVGWPKWWPWPTWACSMRSWASIPRSIRWIPLRFGDSYILLLSERLSGTLDSLIFGALISITSNVLMHISIYLALQCGRHYELFHVVDLFLLRLEFVFTLRRLESRPLIPRIRTHALNWQDDLARLVILIRTSRVAQSSCSLVHWLVRLDDWCISILMASRRLAVFQLLLQITSTMQHNYYASFLCWPCAVCLDVQSAVGGS